MELPLAYRWLKAHNFEGFTPWYLIDPLSELAAGLRKEYQLETGKDLLPFARRQDNDDIAGFEVIDNLASPKVLTVHLTWIGKPEAPGFPRTAESTDMLAWLSEIVLPETQDWMDERELADLISQRG